MDASPSGAISRLTLFPEKMKHPFLHFLAALFLLASSSRAEKTTLPGGAELSRDVPYVTDGHMRQRLDIAVPPGGGKHPLVVWIHGGAWIGGSKERSPITPLLAKGYVIASLNYRYSTQAVFPAQIEDCKSAIRWLRAHAAEYAIDPERIGVWGASAGGHLVAMLGTTAHTREFDKGEHLDQSSAVQCVLNWFGPTDFPGYGEQEVRQMNDPGSVVFKLFGGPISERMELARKASPLCWVKAGAPPFLLMHGTKDTLVPVTQSQRLHDALLAAGCDCTIDVIDGAGHGGPQFTAPERLKAMADFFDRHLLKP